VLIAKEVNPVLKALSDDGIVIGPEVHEIEVWLVIEHVVVDRRDLIAWPTP
jgi:hypothetical protein